MVGSTKWYGVGPGSVAGKLGGVWIPGVDGSDVEDHAGEGVES